MPIAFLTRMHGRLLFTLLALFAALAAWGLVDYLRGRDVSRAYRAALAVGELLLLSEVLIGVLLLAAGRAPARPELHMIYGAVAPLVLPGTYAYLRGRPGRWRPAACAVACLFLCAIALRALSTARLPSP